MQLLTMRGLPPPRGNLPVTKRHRSGKRRLLQKTKMKRLREMVSRLRMAARPKRLLRQERKVDKK